MRLGLGSDISVGYRQPLFGVVPFLLDTYTGAAAAYSLRQLRTGVTNVVRVREDSGNTEQDFTADEITDGTLLAFVGAGNNGYVVTWYDQSGNTGRDATQATAANQPKIVDAGVLVTENGKAAIKFNGSNSLNAGDVINQNYITIVSLTQLDAGGGGGRGIITKATISDDGIGSWELRYANLDVTALRYYIANTRYSLNANGGNGQLLSFAYHISDESAIYENSILVDSDSQSGVLDTDNNDVVIGDFDGGGGGYDGEIQEIILYSSDQSSNRTGIEANINDHYSIYP